MPLSRASSMSDNKMHKRKTKQGMATSVEGTDRKASIKAALKIGKKLDKGDKKTEIFFSVSFGIV